MAPWTLVQISGAIGLACSAWNLFGDLYFLDFYTAHLSNDEFGAIRDSSDLQAGYLFQFNSDNWWIIFLAQSGGWMYPIWAVATTVPLFMGLHVEGNTYWKAMAPCALLFYGLCIMGGALHNAFAFLTALPSVYHNPPTNSGGWDDLADIQDFSHFLQMAQQRMVQHIVVGCIPGYIACNVAGIWIAVLVHFRETKFPKWFNLFNPMVTIVWVQIMGALLPDPWSFYFVGCLGTWGLLMLNTGTTYCLWQDSTGPEYVSSNLLLNPKEGNSKEGPAVMDYSAVHN